MNVYKHLLLDLLGKRQSGHYCGPNLDIGELPTGCVVALMHTNDKIGDAIVRSAFCFGLKLSPLKPKLTIITTARFFDYWSCHPAVDEVMVIPNRKVDGTMRTTAGLAPFLLKNRGRFDVLVNFDQYCRVGEFYKAAMLRSKLTIGFSKETYRLFDYSISNFKDGLSLRTPAERNRDLLALFGVASDEEIQRVHVPTGKSGLIVAPEPRPKILLNAYSQARHRTFSRQTFERVCLEVHRQRPDARIFMNIPLSWPAFIDDDQLTTVKPLKTHWELFDFVNQMDAVVTPDTGIAHIAAGLDKPLFVIFPHSVFFRQAWRPMSDQLAFSYSRTDGNLNDLDWDEVSESIAITLQRMSALKLINA